MLLRVIQDEQKGRRWQAVTSAGLQLVSSDPYRTEAACRANLSGLEAAIAKRKQLSGSSAH